MNLGLGSGPLTTGTTVLLCAVLCACSSTKPSPAAQARARSACATLSTEHTLKAVEKFLQTAMVVNAGDVNTATQALTDAAAHLPEPASAAATRLDELLTVIGNSALREGGVIQVPGRTPQVSPDIKTIVHYCNAHGYPNPDPGN